MSDKPLEPEAEAKSEDVPRLYSQARAPGPRYWDFSASRKEVQSQFRDRIEREHAERAGVGPIVSTTRPAMEQIRAAQFLADANGDVSRGPEQPSRSGPVLAPDPGKASHAREMRELTRGLNSKAAVAHSEPPVTRWFAMQSFLTPETVNVAPPTHSPVSIAQRLPAVVVFSLAGGVGKTCLVATLGRVLSSMGEQVLLADTAPGGVLPFYFGSRDSKPGVVRTFSPPSFSPSPAAPGERHVPIQLLNLEVERFPCYEGSQDLLLGRLIQDGRAASRILIDVATAGHEVNHRLLALDPVVLVPIVPDMNSLATLPALQLSFAQQPVHARVFYLLNQFDPSSALHRDMRELLQVRLGDRLLPFVLRSSASVAEALAEGMTVMDYAPESAAAEDYRDLGGWLGRIAPPQILSARGARWRER